MRVLYFIAYPQRLAGANRSLFELVRHLPKSVTPLVVSVGEGAVVDAYRSAGIPIEVLKPGPSLSTFGRGQLNWSLSKRALIVLDEYMPYTEKLLQLFERFKPDVVHANDPRGALLVGCAARVGGVPFISHLRGGKPFGGMYWWPFEILPDRIITVCERIQEDLAPWARRKAVTVYNGTTDISGSGGPMPWLAQLRRSGVLVVSCFASVTPFKGLHHFLQAAAALNAKGFKDKVVYLSIGDVPEHDQTYYSWLNARREELGADNFMFAGMQGDPFAFYRETDITVLPSIGSEVLDMGGGTLALDLRGTEGFPRTHLEAMCYGIPTIGTDLAGVSEQIVSGVTGFIVPASDRESLTEALEQLLGDSALRARMGAAGRERVLKEFSTERYVDGVVAVYKDLLSEKSKAPPVSAAGRTARRASRAASRWLSMSR